MMKFKEGERVQIIEAPNSYKEHQVLNRTGITKQPQGFDVADDDIIVMFDGGGWGQFKEHQLKKIE